MLPFYEALGRKKLPTVVPIEENQTPKTGRLITSRRPRVSGKH